MTRTIFEPNFISNFFLLLKKTRSYAYQAFVLCLKTQNLELPNVKGKGQVEFFFFWTPKALSIFVLGYKRDAIAMGMLHIYRIPVETKMETWTIIVTVMFVAFAVMTALRLFFGRHTSVTHGGTGGGGGGGLGGGARINNDVEANIVSGTYFGGGADISSGAGFGDGGIGGGAGFGGGGDFGGGGGGGVGGGHVGSAC